MSTKMRFCRVGNELYQADEENFNKFLESAKRTLSSNLKFDPNTQGFHKIGTIADFTQLSSSEAEAMLMGYSSGSADRATHEQQQAASG